MIDPGELGTPLHLEFNASYNLFMGSPAKGWRLDTKQAPAGTMTALGVHQTDYIQTLAGRVKTINARMTHRSNDYPSDDILSIHFEFENGMLGLSLIHISEPTRQEAISYAVFCLKN